MSYRDGLAARRERLAHARLYFVCEADPPRNDLPALLERALSGGVDMVQLRDKQLADADLVEAAGAFREAARRHGALFWLNDRPDLARDVGADGVHVGQDDVPVARARELSGGELLVGLSSHSPEQLDAALAARGAARPDQLSVGPVWETPTKEGRTAAGLEYVRHASARADVPWFAIGGIDERSVDEVVRAGASRAVVVRAIRDAPDPGLAAATIRRALESRPIRR